MPKYSSSSLAKLHTCHPDLQILFAEVVKYFDNTIICGHRSEKDQNEAYEKGYSQVRFPNSKHNSVPSMAVDSVPYPIDWEDKDRMKFYAGFVLGVAKILKQNGVIEHDVISGLDWDGDTLLKDHTFLDHPHFQLKA